MSKRKESPSLDDQENIHKKQKCDEIEILIQSKNPLQEINLNQDKVKQDEHSKNETCKDVILIEEKKKDDDNEEKKRKKLNSIKQINPIKEILKKAKGSGDSSTGGVACELPILPGLFVKDFGEVSMPLCSQQVSELIKMCKQAPYGLNYDTLIDTNVRDSYELEPNQIEILNDEWNKGLNQLVEKVSKELGCMGKVKANLYKMLLYKQGGHFKKHRDTEKEKGMFATLIIQLPSIYTGGELIVYDNDGSAFKYDFGNSNNKSRYLVHYAAHYADLEHEILELKSGYRTVLIYNLCWENGNGSCLNNGYCATNLAASFNILNESFVPLAIFLEHRYTDESLQTNGIKALKGMDNHRYNLLKNANDRLTDDKKLNFYIVKANYVIEEEDVDHYNNSYSCHERNDSEEESSESDDDNFNNYEFIDHSKKIEKMYDSNGKLYKDINMDFKFFTEIIDLNKNVNEKIDLNDRKAWGKYSSRENSGYTGNAGATITTTYQKYFLMILPKSKEMKLAFSISVSHGADKVLKLWNTYSNNKERFLYYFKLLLKQVKEKSKLSTGYYGCSNNALREDQITSISDILFHLNDFSLVQYFLLNCYHKYTVNNCENLANLIKQYGLDKIKPYLSKHFLPVNRTNIATNCCLMQRLFNLNEEELALEFFKECIKPVISDHNVFSDVKNAIDGYARKINLNIYSDILKAILKLEKYDGFETNIEMFKNAIIKTLDTDCYEKLFDSFINNINGYSSIKQILDLFKFRVSWLEDKVKQVPVFSWSMPEANMPRHKQVEDFLRNDRKEMTYCNFDSIKYARNFSNCYGGLKDGYSVRMIPGGTGKNSYVKIIKTSEYHDEHLKKLERYKSELSKIKSLNLNI